MMMNDDAIPRPKPVTGEFHPACLLLPELSDQELAELTDDIREHGLIHPIIADENGLILDGRHRWKALGLLGKESEAKTELFTGTERQKIERVMSENVTRRHLTDKQRQHIAADLATMKRGNPTGANQYTGGNGPSGPFPSSSSQPVMTNAQAAKVMKVSERSVKRARAIKQRDPEAHEKAKRGERKPKLTIKHGIAQEDLKRLEAGYPDSRIKELKTALVKAPRGAATILIKKVLAAIDAGRILPQGVGSTIDPRMFWPDLPEGFCRYLVQTKQSLATLAKEQKKLGLISQECATLSGDSAEDRARAIWARADALTPPTIVKPVPKVRLIPEGLINKEVYFYGSMIWPRDEEHETWLGVKVSEADVIVAWNLVHYLTGRLETAKPEDPNVVGRDLGHLTMALDMASSLEGVTRVMHQCISAYRQTNGDRNAKTNSPGQLEILPAWEKAQRAA